MKVTTYNNNTVDRTKCRKIKGTFYEINKDCFFVDGKWHRINNGLIVKNHTTGQYIKKENAKNVLNYGIVGKNSKGLELGFFEEDPNIRIFCKKVATGGELSLCSGDNIPMAGDIPKWVQESLQYQKTWSLPCRTEELAKSMGYEYGYTDDILYPKTKEFAGKFRKGLGQGYGHLNYGSDNKLNDSSRIHKNMYSKPVTAEHRRLARLLSKRSFGLEFETSNGYIADPITKELGLIPVLDGSLRKSNGSVPYEFVTIPLSGATGVSTLDNVCKVLEERTSIDKKCSMHLHMGNIPYDEGFIVTMYKLVYMVQNELYQMFPQYKVDPSIISSSKNYCKPLPEQYCPKTIPNLRKLTKAEWEEYISQSFNRIYSFVSCGQTPNRSYNRTVLEHPVSQSKWHINSRYHIVNFLPLMFKSFRTLEFRVHTPTSNRYKVFNWMLISNALITFAMNEQHKVLMQKSVSLSTIMKSVYSKAISDRLIKYIDNRKSEFKSGKDADGSQERKLDNKYEEKAY